MLDQCSAAELSPGLALTLVLSGMGNAESGHAHTQWHSVHQLPIEDGATPSLASCAGHTRRAELVAWLSPCLPVSGCDLKEDGEEAGAWYATGPERQGRLPTLVALALQH